VALGPALAGLPLSELDLTDCGVNVRGAEAVRFAVSLSLSPSPLLVWSVSFLSFVVFSSRLNAVMRLARHSHSLRFLWHRICLAHTAQLSSGCQNILTGKLTSIALRKNPLGPAGVKAITSILETENAIASLDLGETGCFGSDVLASLSRCLCGALRRVRLDGNRFAPKDKKGPRVMSQGDKTLSLFTSAAVQLVDLDLGRSAFPVDALQVCTFV
jgi:hypothetical protein